MYEYCVDFNEKYVSFVNSLKQPLTHKSVDFLGLNLYEGQSDPVFKVYYANKFSSGSDHPLITFLSEKGMLRYAQAIKYTNGHCIKKTYGFEYGSSFFLSQADDAAVFRK